MGTYIVYIIKTALCLTVLYLPYTLMLRRESFYRINRIALLAIVAAAFLIPALQIHFSSGSMQQINAECASWQQTAARYIEQPTKRVAGSIGATGRPAATSTDKVPQSASASVIPTETPSLDSTLPAPSSRPSLLSLWPLFLLATYLLGCIVIFIFRIQQIVRLALFIPHHCLWKKRLDSGAIVYCHAADLHPFSWMHSIVVSKADTLTENYPVILAHEEAHVHCGHSYDILLIVVAETLQWFNPVIWMLHQDLCAVHEYQADDAVLHKGYVKQNYQLFLISRLANARLNTVANGFSAKSVRSRILMMARSSSRWMFAKYVYLIPMSVFAVIAFASPTLAEIGKKVEASKNEMIDRLKTETSLLADTTKTATGPDQLEQVKAFETSANDHGLVGWKMPLRKGYTATLTASAANADTTFTLTVLDRKGNVVSRKVLGHDNTRSIFGIKSHSSLHADTLMHFTACEGLNVNDWTWYNHLHVWVLSWYIRGHQYYVDGKGQIHIGKLFETSLSENYSPYMMKSPIKRSRFLKGNIDFVYGLSQDKNIPENLYEARRGAGLLLSQKLKNEKVYMTAAKLPSYPGKEDDAIRFLQQWDLHGKTGYVLVRFIVRSNGAITDVHVLGSTNEEFNDCLEQAFYNMPKWNPARDKNGKAVSMMMNMPFCNDGQRFHVDNTTAALTMKRVYKDCISSLTVHGANLSEYIGKHYLTNQLRASLRQPVPQVLLDNDYIDAWVERTLETYQMPDNWVMVEYHMACFTPQAEDKCIALHLIAANGSYKIDRIVTTPEKDARIQELLRRMVFDSRSLLPSVFPSFVDPSQKTTPFSIYQLKNAEYGSVEYTVTWDAKIKDIHSDLNSEGAKEAVEHLQHVENVKPAYMFGMPTNIRMHMDVLPDSTTYIIR
jgi:beta-lactamase regulating signal transducer with metallopeptidase domain